jgi:hypothetical protein
MNLPKLRSFSKIVRQQASTFFSGKLPAGKHHLSLTDKINNLPAEILFIKTAIKDQAGLVKIKDLNH